MGFGGEYRILLYRDDGSLSFVMAVNARAEMDAKDEAERMLKNGLVCAEIWRDEVRICSIDHRTGHPVVEQSAPNSWQ